jgi:hypothetical protein
MLRFPRNRTNGDREFESIQFATEISAAKTTRKQHHKLPGGITGKGFMSGQCGNPKGRPRTATFSEIAQEILAEEDPKKQQTVAESLVRAAVSRALARSVEVLLSYTEGRP